MIEQWAEEIEAAGRAALDRVEHLPAVPQGLEAVIGYGESWDEALEDVDWRDGDVLVVGSSSMGPVARVFLGSRASKIVRHSPVPVVVVPRGAAAELAEPGGAGRDRAGIGELGYFDPEQRPRAVRALERGGDALRRLTRSDSQRDEHGRCRQPPQQRAEQFHRSSVSPVQIVEHEHQRPARRQSLKQLAHRAVTAVALVLERCLTG